jgi:hypothetical protein
MMKYNDADLLMGAPKPTQSQLSSSNRVGGSGRGRGSAPTGGRTSSSNAFPKTQGQPNGNGRSPTSQQTRATPSPNHRQQQQQPQRGAPARSPTARPQPTAARGGATVSAPGAAGRGGRGGETKQQAMAVSPRNSNPTQGRPAGNRGPAAGAPAGAARGLRRPEPGRSRNPHSTGVARGGRGGSMTTTPIMPRPKPRRLEPLEIETKQDNDNGEEEEEEEDEEEDEDENDMESLLARDSTNGQSLSPTRTQKSGRKTKQRPKRTLRVASTANTTDVTASARSMLANIYSTVSPTCQKVIYCNGHIRPQAVGNMWILLPDLHKSTGWGVAGPQWWGPIFVWMILLVATHFCIHGALKIGPVTVVLCIVFCTVATSLLLDVSYRDPGICTKTEILGSEEGEGDTDVDWRWCDFCKVYQPPDGAHCPECNICVAGYDHHCVWMGK